MSKSNSLEPSDNLPNMGGPACRALAHAGYLKLEDLTKMTEEDLLNVHGVGPKAVRVLREALEGAGLSFRHN